MFDARLYFSCLFRELDIIIIFQEDDLWFIVNIKVLMKYKGSFVYFLVWLKTYSSESVQM